MSAHLDPGAGFAWLRTVVLNVALVWPSAREYAEVLGGRGGDGDERVAAAERLAFASCGVRATRDRLVGS